MAFSVEAHWSSFDESFGNRIEKLGLRSRRSTIPTGCHEDFAVVEQSSGEEGSTRGHGADLAKLSRRDIVDFRGSGIMRDGLAACDQDSCRVLEQSSGVTLPRQKERAG